MTPITEVWSYERYSVRETETYSMPRWGVDDVPASVVDTEGVKILSAHPDLYPSEQDYTVLLASMAPALYNALLPFAGEACAGLCEHACAFCKARQLIDRLQPAPQSPYSGHSEK